MQLSKEKKIKKRSDESRGEFICCCLSCWLLAVGTGILLDAQFEFETGVITVIWQTLVATLLTALLSRKWWIPIAYFGGIFVIGAIVIAAMGDFGSTVDSIVGFFKWWIELMPRDSDWYSEKSVYIIHVIVNIGISVLFFTVYRLTKKSYIMAILSVGIIVVIYAFGYTKYNILAIPFFFVGFFTLIAAEKFRGHRFFGRKEIFAVLGNKWLVTVVSAVVCLVIGLGSVYTFGEDKDYGLRNRFCSEKAADIQTVTGFYSVEQQSVDLTLLDLGLQNNSKYIGGNIPKKNSGILAYTNSKQPALIKMTAFDSYDGELWKNSFEKNYRINGPWQEEQDALLASESIHSDETYDAVASLGEERNISFILEGENTIFLPTTGQILGFTENTETVNPILFDKKGQLFTYFGQEKGYSYSLDTFTYYTDRELTRGQVKTVKELTKKDDPQMTKDFIEHYTAMPYELPEAGLALLDTLNLDPEDDYSTAVKLSQYFSAENGYTYTKRPPKFNRKYDIVDVTFKTKTGHCVYYATTLITLLRHLDIPCRLAAGYITATDKSGVQVIDASNPYCWVECYFPNMGWVSFDPSPGQLVSLVPGKGENQEEKPDKDKPKEPELEKPEEKPEQEEEPVVVVEEDNTLLITLIVCGSAVLVLIIYLLLRAIWAPKLYEPERVGSRFISPEKQAEFYRKDILRQLKNIKVYPKESETLREQALRACEELIYHNQEAILGAVEVLEALRYGGITPTSGDIYNLYNALQMLDLEAKWKMKPLSYFLKRRMFLPLL